jgi:PLP dependent protein
MISRSLADIRLKIAAAAKRADRKTSDITLIAVAKTYPVEAVEAALAEQQTIFGENRVQEAQAKYATLRANGTPFELHLIGPLQTNKTKDAVALFDAIHSLDRSKLAAALASEFEKTARRPALFIQVNTGAEPQKAGILPQDADQFIDTCRDLHGLAITGLMCIPPADEPPAPHFALLREIAKRTGVTGLSMGMSADFETAIALGATHIRVGSAIFGKRDPAI